MGARTRSPAETELRAQVAGLPGLPHPSTPTCAETATRSVRFAPSITRLGRADAARTLGTHPGRPAWSASRSPETRPAPGRRALPTAPPRSRRPLRPANARRTQKGVFERVPCAVPRGTNFAPATAGTGRPQDSPSLSSGSSSSSHRSPAVPAVAFAIAGARWGHGKRVGGSGRGCRGRGGAQPGRPIPPGARGHCGRGASGATRPISRAVRGALVAGLRRRRAGNEGGAGRGGAGRGQRPAGAGRGGTRADPLDYA